MAVSIQNNNAIPPAFFPWKVNDASQANGGRTVTKTGKDLKKLHDQSEKILFDWLENPPVDRRQLQALNLLAEAVQMLHAACINMGAVEVQDSD